MPNKDDQYNEAYEPTIVELAQKMLLGYNRATLAIKKLTEENKKLKNEVEILTGRLQDMSVIIRVLDEQNRRNSLRGRSYPES